LALSTRDREKARRVAARSPFSKLGFAGIISAAIVLNEMRRLTETAKLKSLHNISPTTPKLSLEPQANCSRYDELRSVRHVH